MSFENQRIDELRVSLQETSEKFYELQSKLVEWDSLIRQAIYNLDSGYLTSDYGFVTFQDQIFDNLGYSFQDDFSGFSNWKVASDFVVTNVRSLMYRAKENRNNLKREIGKIARSVQMIENELHTFEIYVNREKQDMDELNSLMDDIKELKGFL